MRNLDLLYVTSVVTRLSQIISRLLVYCVISFSFLILPVLLAAAFVAGIPELFQDITGTRIF